MSNSYTVNNTPENKNFLSPLNYKFLLKRAPHINFFTQNVQIPSISLPYPEPNNPFVKDPQPGDHLIYEPLQIVFKVDEDLQNYLEIRNWLVALGFPESFDQYEDLYDKDDWTGESIYSDISVMALTSHQNSNYEFTFVDCMPNFLSSISFNSTDPDVNFITATASFKYTYFTIKAI